MIKAVLLDAIDTIFRPYPDKINMYRRSIKKVSNMDISYEKMALVWNEIVSTTEEEAAREMNPGGALAWDGFNQKIMELLDYKGDTVEAGSKLLYEAWSNPENFTLYDDVIPALKILREKPIVIACASNENKGLYNFFTHFKIAKFFDHIIISEELGVEKPNLYFFKKALARVGVGPEKSLHVGDSLISDYNGAEKAGLQAVLIDRTDKKLENSNIVKIKSLVEIERFLGK